MTTVETHTEVHAVDDHEDKSDFYFVKVAIGLAVMTAVEVALSYLKFPAPWTTVALFVLMILKFITVTSFFMHLKWDHKWFSYLFYTGLILSVAVYAAMLTCFQIWAK
jgi:cytochrome c oxidase subunit IV